MAMPSCTVRKVDPSFRTLDFSDPFPPGITSIGTVYFPYWFSIFSFAFTMPHKPHLFRIPGKKSESQIPQKD